MARNQVTVPTVVGDWTQISNSDIVGTFTFEVIGATHFIRYTADATKPTEPVGQIYPSGTGEQQKTMAEVVNLSGAVRIWAKPVGGNAGEIFIDHA